MKFSETQATELIKNHNLPPNIIKVWEFRNIIPDIYYEDLKQPIVSSRDQRQLVHLNSALDTGKINISAVCKLADVKSAAINDFCRQNGLLKLEDLTALKKVINKLRISFSKVLAEFEKDEKSEVGIILFKHLFKRSEIVWFLFFDRNRGIYQKFGTWKISRRSFPFEEVTQLKSFILIFLTETVI